MPSPCYKNNISRLVASEQVAIDDLDGLRYWVNLIASYGYAPEDRSDKEIFQPALALFGYHRIPELGRKLGVMDWSMYDETHASQISESVGRPFMEARPVSGNLSNAKE